MGRRKNRVALQTMVRFRTSGRLTLGATRITRAMIVDVHMVVMHEGGSGQHTQDIGILDHASVLTAAGAEVTVLPLILYRMGITRQCQTVGGTRRRNTEANCDSSTARTTGTRGFQGAN
jgi:hypothetical protein